MTSLDFYLHMPLEFNCWRVKTAKANSNPVWSRYAKRIVIKMRTHTSGLANVRLTPSHICVGSGLLVSEALCLRLSCICVNCRIELDRESLWEESPLFFERIEWNSAINARQHQAMLCSGIESCVTFPGGLFTRQSWSKNRVTEREPKVRALANPVTTVWLPESNTCAIE